MWWAGLWGDRKVELLGALAYTMGMSSVQASQSMDRFQAVPGQAGGDDARALSLLLLLLIGDRRA